MHRADLPQGNAGQLDGNGGMRGAGAWRLCLTCLTCRTSWCAPVYPVGLLAAVWYGSGEDVPLGYARQLDDNGGMRVAGAWRLHKTYKTYKTYKMMMGVRHGIPRGFACRSLVWLGRRCAARVKPAKKSGGETRRVSRCAHEQVCEGFLRDPSLKRSGNAPDRYTAFFAKLFFTRKKSGPLPGFFCQAFFHFEKKRGMEDEAPGAEMQRAAA